MGNGANEYFAGGNVLESEFCWVRVLLQFEHEMATDSGISIRYDQWTELLTVHRITSVIIEVIDNNQGGRA